MIRREQVADLHPGDTLELRFAYCATTLTVRGVFPEITDWYDNYLGGPYTLTVISRAPRLYVNSDRTEPVPGDVAKDADGHEPSGHTWHYLGDDEGAHWWRFDDRIKDCQPKRLRLLVDGETGRVVP